MGSTTKEKEKTLILRKQMIGKSFHSLPKDLRELIWDEFEGKELYRKRAVCKKWQEGLDNPRRTSLKKKMESCEKERRIHDQFFLVMPTEERSYKILLLGNAAVGKTSLLWRYTENFFQDFYIYTVYSYYFIPPHLRHSQMFSKKDRCGLQRMPYQNKRKGGEGDSFQNFYGDTLKTLCKQVSNLRKMIADDC